MNVLSAGLVMLALVASTGGPDRGGYRWDDSREPGGPQYDWVDITAVGTPISLGDDDNRGPFALGFSLPFYDTVFDSLRVCSNGWSSFISESHQFHHYPLPSSRDPNAVLAPLWTDLDPGRGGSVRYWADSAGDRFVLSWDSVPVYGAGESVTFQVVVASNGEVLFQYRSIPPELRSCALGIEDRRGETGLEYFYDGAPPENVPRESLAVRFRRLDHDVCPWVLARPFGEELTGAAVVPAALVWNPGLEPASFPVTLDLGPGYSERLDIAGLSGLADTLVEFPAWPVASGTTQCRLVTGLAGDEFPGNDTLTGCVLGTHQGELRHDDGEADTSFLRVGSPSADWAAAVSFVPPGGCRLLGGRVFVLDTLPFARVLACPDNAGEPDLDHPYFEAESVAAGTGTWLEVEADTFVGSGEDIWLVAFWPRSADGPAIGDDRDRPVDMRSCFGSPSVGWFAHGDGDLMMRLRVEPTGGITAFEEGRTGAVRAEPNPFRERVGLLLTDVPRGGLTGRIYDAGGRLVRVFEIAAGQTGWEWDGRDRAGSRLAAGAYFIELRAPGPAGRVRVLLTR